MCDMLSEKRSVPKGGMTVTDVRRIAGLLGMQYYQALDAFYNTVHDVNFKAILGSGTFY